MSDALLRYEYLPKVINETMQEGNRELAEIYKMQYEAYTKLLIEYTGAHYKLIKILPTGVTLTK